MKLGLSGLATTLATMLATILATTATTLAAQTPAAAARSNAPKNGANATPAEAAGPVLTTTAVAGRQSWFSDRRDYHLGDIVTVLVDEYTLTSLDKEVNATENRQRSLGLGLNTPSSNKTYGINSNNNNQSQNSGLDARTNRLTTDMSARVVAIAPNGIMQLKGTKIINVEESKVNLTLTGWVRVQDVAPDNSIQSFRMADAALDYQADGPLGKAKSGIIGRLLGAFWP
ncbi:MAG: flagellar basal body L-ring protein FlgH [Gemmatimonadota bacterium]|nr:flagellar basal body L-ring protein FlgH [Gemmatimonadota bacterium]